MPEDNYTLHCPECGEVKQAEWMIGTRKYSVCTLDVPYYMCSECRLIHIDKASVKRAIASWRSTIYMRNLKDTPTSKIVYQEMLKVLEEIVDGYCRQAGYKRAKFKKTIS